MEKNWFSFKSACLRKRLAYDFHWVSNSFGGVLFSIQATASCSEKAKLLSVFPKRNHPIATSIILFQAHQTWLTQVYSESCLCCFQAASQAFLCRSLASTSILEYAVQVPQVVLHKTWACFLCEEGRGAYGFYVGWALVSGKPLANVSDTYSKFKQSIAGIFG